MGVQAAIFEDEVEELQQQLDAEIVRRTDAEKLVPDFEKELDTILQLLTAESFRAEAFERERNDLLERHTSLSQERAHSVKSRRGHSIRTRSDPPALLNVRRPQPLTRSDSR